MEVKVSRKCDGKQGGWKTRGRAPAEVERRGGGRGDSEVPPSAIAGEAPGPSEPYVTVAD